MTSQRAASVAEILLGPSGYKIDTPDKSRYLNEIANVKWQIYLEKIDKILSWMGQNTI